MPLTHPTREIFAAPATFEFKEPFKGTYPPEYDLTYWYQGVKPHVHIRQQIKVLASNLFYEFETLFLFAGWNPVNDAVSRALRDWPRVADS